MDKETVFFLGAGDTEERPNPYISLLAGSLRNQGVEVSLIRSRELAKYILSTNNGRVLPPVIHIHWIQWFYRSINPLVFLTRLGLFKSFLKWLRPKVRGIVWTAHNVHSHEHTWLKLENMALSTLLPMVDRIIVHGDGARQEVQERLKIYDDSIFKVIPHGNYISYYENTINKVEARRRLGIDTEATVFLFFGMLREYKGIRELIQGFSWFPCDRYRLIIAGPSHDAKLTREICNLSHRDERIRLFIGYIPKEQVQVFCNAADLMILPYRDVLTSGAAMLSLSFGLPILSPSMGHLKDIIEYGASYPIMDVSPDGIAKAIHESLKLDLATMRDRALNFVQQYPWEKVAKLTKKVYSELPRYANHRENSKNYY